jgi:ABC-type multidrug transport system fused ATPase/permease subunit
MDHHNHDHDHDHYHDHKHTLQSELFHHLPYAIFSVAFSLIILSFVTLALKNMSQPAVAQKGAQMLFHSFHFMHIVFAATGTIITFRRFCKDLFPALLIGLWSPILFCTLSDSILPYLGGRALGVNMSFHLCFFTELANVLPFLFVGIINGFVMSKHSDENQKVYSIFSHFIHIFVSSLASTFYLVAHGFIDWYASIGFVFLFIIMAVVIPCTLSDVVVPIAYARMARKNEKH